MAGPGRMRGDGRKAANPGKTLLRLLSYMKKYIPLLVFVFLCIIATSVAQAQGSRALGPLVDDYILPMVANGSTDFGPLKAYLVKLACIFGFGILGTFLFNYLMVGVTQGVQKTIRDDLFAKMQRLPLRYFDSHAAGDIMSRYTSDIDTLRQVISQSIPQCVSSAVTLVVVLWNLIDTSWILTLVMFFTVGLIIYVTKVLAGKSAGFFIGQQRALGTVNGYIEEMISGQKVVKIFNHEEVCKEDFDKLNEELRVNAYSAGKFSNMLGPINNNLGYVQYAVLAVVGGLLCVSSHSSPANITRDWQRHFGMTPDEIFGWELGPEKRKPSPYALQQIMRHYRLEPQQLVMIDDLKPGYEMAKRCGVDFIAAGWSHRFPEIRQIMQENCDHYMQTVENLEKFLFS